jgi:hypothetical protein
MGAGDVLVDCGEQAPAARAIWAAGERTGFEFGEYGDHDRDSLGASGRGWTWG